MESISSEIFLIIFLLIINGFFAASEIAVISLRKSRIKELIKRGDKRGKIIADLTETPEKFLATIQVGITLVGTCASAFGGHALGEKIGEMLKHSSVPFLAQYADFFALGFIIIVISFLEIIIGELVPKSLALHFSEKIALVFSYPLKAFAFIAYPFTKFLTWISNIILMPFKKNTDFASAKMSEEELKYLLKESKNQGTLERQEHEIIENLLSFTDRSVSMAMVPVDKIQSLNAQEKPAILLHEIQKSRFSRVPVYDDEKNNMIGILPIIEVLKSKVTKENFKIQDFLSEPLYMPRTQRLPDALQKIKKANTHMAFIVDEHGNIDGIITLEDILEELIGEIHDENDIMHQPIIELSQGRYLIEGDTSIADINRELKTELPENKGFTTISGLILEELGRFPQQNETLDYKNYRIKIKASSTKKIEAVEFKIMPASN